MVNARALVLFYVCAAANAASLHSSGGSDVRTAPGRVDIDIDLVQGSSSVADLRGDPSTVANRRGSSLGRTLPDAFGQSQFGQEIPSRASDHPSVPAATKEAVTFPANGPTSTSRSPHLRRASSSDVATEGTAVANTASEPVSGFSSVETSGAHSSQSAFPTSSFDSAVSVTATPSEADPFITSTVIVTGSPSSTPESASTASTEDHDGNTTYTRALIIVIVVQAVLLLVLIATLVVVLVRRRNASRMAREHRYVKMSERFESPRTPRPDSFGTYTSRPETMYSLDQVPFIQHQPLPPLEHEPEHGREHDEHEHEHAQSPSRRSSVSTVSRYSQ
ncbi:hypothetical protein GY45DRAFT_1331750 [Cubamyces sp. BRFM 1775]|nr:hypothetical protein GY45DRAFT_1331750 [Cubamyces sp. BRFM 1775]